MAYYSENLDHHNDEVVKHEMTIEELEFLQNLQKELNTQNTLSQADPRFWVIKGTEKIETVCEDKYDDIDLFDTCSLKTVCHGKENIETFVKDEIIAKINKFQQEKILCKRNYDDEIIILNNKDEYITCDTEETIDWINKKAETEYELVYYKKNKRIYESTMFLTHKEAIKHLQANKYRYSNDAHTYVMTAWRSPEVEKLIKILQNVDWNKTKANKGIGFNYPDGKEICENDIVIFKNETGVIRYGEYGTCKGERKTHIGFYVDWNNENCLIRQDLGFLREHLKKVGVNNNE